MSDRAKGKNDSHNKPPMIEAAGLSKFYGIFTACRDVSFKVYEGELVAFLGPNGAGKSTTMKMLTGYLAPSEGVARIAGHDMATDRLAGSTRLGYLPENGPLVPGHDAPQPAELLCLGARACPGPAARSGSTQSSKSASWVRCCTSRSANCPRGIGSDSGWPIRCCTNRTC